MTAPDLQRTEVRDRILRLGTEVLLPDAVDLRDDYGPDGSDTIVVTVRLASRLDDNRLDSDAFRLIRYGARDIAEQVFGPLQQIRMLYELSDPDGDDGVTRNDDCALHPGAGFAEPC